MLASDRELPVAGGPEKRAYVRETFTAIAPTYDRLNRIISLRFDRRWRRFAVRRLGWERVPDGIYLDLCAGTLDFAAMLARQPGFRGRVVGADFVRGMLTLGRSKAPRLQPVTADALELPFPGAVFDGAMVGWGIRNLVDIDAGLAEAARVLRAGARLVILEMTLPPQRHFRQIFQFYFRRILPWIGRRISKHTTAYRWLPESTQSFPSPDEFAARMRAGGFRDVTYTLFLGGVCAMHVGTKEGEGRMENGERG
ncbi:MAG TPA: ubiquinone/menaquinone biosynthesis methyltransferase [Gemmatimonadales bacterium]|jgi:demethylmenaquinone methyltransferase/2-methoxy-6-polyprenyl-1,4-benzoquinol methylase